MSTTQTSIFRAKTSVFGKRVHFNVPNLGWSLEQHTTAEYVGQTALLDAVSSYVESLEMVPAFNLADNQEYVEPAQAAIPDSIEYLTEQLKSLYSLLVDDYNYQRAKFEGVDESCGKLLEVNNEYFCIRIELFISAHME